MASSENSSSNGFLSASQVAEVSSKDVRRGQFSKDEVALIIRMYKLVGKRWSLIAGRIPGRTADEIEKFWRSRNPTSGPME